MTLCPAGIVAVTVMRAVRTCTALAASVTVLMLVAVAEEEEFA